MEGLKSRDDRLNLLRSVAKFESRICSVTKSEPYFDELHDFYEFEIDHFAAASIEKIRKTETLKRMTQALVTSNYKPADAAGFFSRLCGRYLDLARQDSEALVNAVARHKNLRKLSELQHSITYFGI